MQKPEFVFSALTVTLGLLLSADIAVAQTQAQTQAQPQAQTPTPEQAKVRREKPVDFEKCPIAGCQDQAQTQQETRTSSRSRERVYGSQLMTHQERIDYHAKMQSLKTKEERDAFRAEHHTKMQERAKERGVRLSDMPPAQGAGMGPGGGMGGGMGPGGGMGGGRNR